MCLLEIINWLNVWVNIVSIFVKYVYILIRNRKNAKTYLTNKVRNMGEV